MYVKIRQAVQARSIVFLFSVAVMVVLVAVVALHDAEPAHTSSSVTATPPSTVTGGVPTADYTSEPDVGPPMDEDFWLYTATPDAAWTGATPTVPPTP